MLSDDIHPATGAANNFIAQEKCESNLLTILQ